MARATKKAQKKKASFKVKWWMAAGAVLVVSFLISAGFYWIYDALPSYWQGVATNTGGSFIDIVLVVVALGLYDDWRQKQDDISRLRERIEDVRRFDDPRAHSIIGAAIRGLARHRLTDIDLRGAHLTDFSFANNGISSLAGSVISDGFYLHNEMRNFGQFRKVNFSQVKCDNTCFGKGSLSFAVFEDCNFFGASLVGATFDGITMRWSDGKVVDDGGDWDEIVDTAGDGSPIFARTYAPAFEEADLTDCSFKGVRFKNADFRRAYNVDKADFTGATGLETCYFEEGMRPSS
jgi:hypothetical protein